jgi:integrase
VHSALTRKFSECGRDGPWSISESGAFGNPLESKVYKNWHKGLRKTLRDVVIKSSLPMTYDRMEILDQYFSSGETGMSFHKRIMVDTLFSLAWYCMLRMDEACKLKIRDVRFDMTKLVNGQVIR